MESNRPVSRLILVRVLIIMLLTCLTIDAGSYWLFQNISAKTRKLMEASPSPPEISVSAAWGQAVGNAYWAYLVPASIIIFILTGVLLWILLRRPVIQRIQAGSQPRKVEKRLCPRDEARQEAETTERIFLHLLSVLQREGRLVDFFSENLTQYPDAQIGAAVRNIHENCKRTLEKYLAPQAVLEQREGESITVDQDFNPNAIKLIGNVTGRPPFLGTVRHRGWRASKIELPTYSGRQDSAIIAPAEVEVG